MAQVQPGELVLDIGAGTGAITHALVAAGARVVAVELHHGRAAILRSRFASQPVTVVRADASSLRLPARPFKVVANPPFGVTTSLLRQLTSPRSQLECGVIVLPVWAATRWASGRGVGGITARQLFSMQMGPRVPAGAFQPAPPADARVLIVTRASSRARSR